MLEAPSFPSVSSVLATTPPPHAMDLSQGLLVTFGDMLFPDVVCRRSDMERGSEPMFGLTLFNLYTRGQGDQSEEDRSSCFQEGCRHTMGFAGILETSLLKCLLETGWPQTGCVAAGDLIPLPSSLVCWDDRLGSPP